MHETAPMTANGKIDPITLEQLEQLARSHPRSGREAQAKASALRTLERLARDGRRSELPPCRSSADFGAQREDRHRPAEAGVRGGATHARLPRSGFSSDAEVALACCCRCDALQAWSRHHRLSGPSTAGRLRLSYISGDVAKYGFSRRPGRLGLAAEPFDDCVGARR